MQEVLSYLKENVDKNAAIQKWDAKQCLNMQLAGLYEYYMVSILDTRFLLINPQDSLIIPKSKIHMANIEEKAGYDTALLIKSPTAYQLKKLLAERIPFISADRQMYLPFMALDIKRKNGQEMDEVKRESFTAATQLIFLYILYSEKQEFDTGELAGLLGISAMTVLRAMNELVRIGVILLKIEGQTGRKKIYRPIDKKEYYHKGREFLRNPVKEIIYVREIPKDVHVLKSGLSALAARTMLAEPDHEVYAVYGTKDLFLKYKVSESEALSEEMPQIEIMDYDVGKLANDSFVDPVSLIKSIRERDERVEIAIDELMKGIPWYEE